MTRDAGTDAGFPDPCVECDLTAYPPECRGPRRGPGHVSVRFGDAGRYHVHLEGIRVDDCVLEALAGDPGLALVEGAERHGDHRELVVRRGRVEVEPVPDAHG